MSDMSGSPGSAKKKRKAYMLSETEDEEDLNRSGGSVDGEGMAGGRLLKNEFVSHTLGVC